MKFCDDHWQKLRAAIAARGLDGLVARDGATAAANLQADVDDAKKGMPADPARFDPLMSAHNMVMTAALRMGGLYLLAGDYCPVCEVKKNMAGKPDEAGKVWSADDIERDWINGPADGALGYAREHNLVPGAQ